MVGLYIGWWWDFKFVRVYGDYGCGSGCDGNGGVVVDGFKVVVVVICRRGIGRLVWGCLVFLGDKCYFFMLYISI